MKSKSDSRPARPRTPPDSGRTHEDRAETLENDKLGPDVKGKEDEANRRLFGRRVSGRHLQRYTETRWRDHAAFELSLVDFRQIGSRANDREAQQNDPEPPKHFSGATQGIRRVLMPL